MNTPLFTAEASLYKTSEGYQLTAAWASGSQRITPLKMASSKVSCSRSWASWYSRRWVAWISKATPARTRLRALRREVGR